MPRRPSFVTFDVPRHIVQSGNNRQSCFDGSAVYYACYIGESWDPIRVSIPVERIKSARHFR